MMDKITVSAPGKLMLLGEHAVVYGYPCIVSAVDNYLSVKGEVIDSAYDQYNIGETNDDFIETAVDTVRKKYHIDNKVILTTTSELTGYGLGSSAAVTVATIKLLDEFFDIGLRGEDLFNLSYKCIRKHQPLASGYDIASAIYGGTIYFDGRTKKVKRLSDQSLKLIIGFSGIKADTVDMVRKVSDLNEKNPDITKNIFISISTLVKNAEAAIINKDWKLLGKLMNQNQELLVKLGVSSPKLDEMVKSAVTAGAYGAKISGAGGGDCIIALIEKSQKEKIEKAIINTGGEILHLDVGNPMGVCLS